MDDLDHCYICGKIVDPLTDSYGSTVVAFHGGCKGKPGEIIAKNNHKLRKENQTLLALLAECEEVVKGMQNYPITFGDIDPELFEKAIDLLPRIRQARGK